MDYRRMVPVFLLALPACQGAPTVESASRIRTDLSPGMKIAERSRPSASRVRPDGIRSDLFNAPEPPAPRKPAPPPEPPTPPGPSTAPAPLPDPMAGWEYVGDVEIDGQRLALLERKDSKEGIYLRAGDSFSGGKVASFDKQQIRIAMADSERGISRKQDWLFHAPRAAAGGANRPPQQGTLSAPGSPGNAVAANPAGDSASMSAVTLKKQAVEALQLKMMETPVFYGNPPPIGGEMVIESVGAADPAVLILKE